MFVLLKKEATMEAVHEKQSTWGFGTRQVVYAAIGAALYGGLSWLFNAFPLPAAGNVSFRPPVAVLVFFSLAFGPWVGLLAGLVGNTIGDALTGWGLYWNWSVGNGLMGLIPGLAMNMIHDWRGTKDIVTGIGWGLLGDAIGMLFASLTEIFVGGITLGVALGGYFLPAAAGNAVVIIILLPILMVAYAAVVNRRGR
jgi:energy-coupling factor transport system substrate-specific component